jgi:Na+-driven multidrug efflux pump
LRVPPDDLAGLLATFTGLILGRVLLACIFAWLHLPVVWVYGALMADYVIKAIMLVARFRSGRWQGVLLRNIA